MSKGKIGVLCGGGPAPGFNAVIASVVIRANELGYDVIGILEGFNYIQTGKLEDKNCVELKASDVSRILYVGGSIIRSSRANPKNYDKKDEKTGFLNCVKALKERNIKYLVTIGGDDTCSSSDRLFIHSKGEIKCCHIPKTIDNDLPLPDHADTFGYKTAVELGSNVVTNLMYDASTSGKRFFIVNCMGRKSGYLSLGIGLAASAHLTLIPEEFVEPGKEFISLELAMDVLEGCIVKRMATGSPHGVIIIAEGLIEFCDPKEVEKLFKDDIEYDEHGNIRLALLDLEGLVKKRITQRLKSRNLKTSLTTKKLGYELRCHRPIASDRVYCRKLGWSAATYLLKKDSRGGALMSIVDEKANPIPFESLKKTKNGSTEIRTVDVTGESFEMAKTFMIRISKYDFENPKMVEKLAKAGNFKDVEDFNKYFARLKKHENRFKYSL